MCLIAELAMMIFGIVTLVRGKFSLTRTRVVTGFHAYAIGIVLTATLPVLLAVGFVIGVAAVAASGGRPPDLNKLAFLDPVIVALSLLIVTVIALSAPKTRA
jgi:hypothetical protein